MVRAESENTGKLITRNISFYKEIPDITQIAHAQQEEDANDRDIQHEQSKNPHDHLQSEPFNHHNVKKINHHSP